MDTSERRALGALWSLQGVGEKSIEALEAVGPLGDLLRTPVRQWRQAPGLSGPARAALAQVDDLERAAERLERELARGGQRVVFPGQPAWPELLLDIADPPRLLFVEGPGNEAAPRRRVAVVGTRTPESAARGPVRRLAYELAQLGLGVVSGAAEGLDQEAHGGALEAKGETWAFMGAALDQLDPPQARLRGPFRAGEGTFFSTYPPGARADKSTFARRNRFIAGSSDAVVVARAPTTSGALYTARAALEQGRPLLVVPADPWNSAGAGSNLLLRKGARVCLTAEDVLQAVGLGGTRTPLSITPEPTSLEQLSGPARAVLGALQRLAADTDALAARTGLDAGTLRSALQELEIEGLALQRGGARWERK